MSTDRINLLASIDMHFYACNLIAASAAGCDLDLDAVWMMLAL
jgi:hypothetical protein